MDSFSLINDPRNEYGKLYTVDKLGNLWGARPVLCAYLSLALTALAATDSTLQMLTPRSRTSSRRL